MLNHLQTKKFKFTTANLKALPRNPSHSSSTELEFSDTEVIGLKCLSGKTDSKRFMLRYSINEQKKSIAIGRFPDVDLMSARKIARTHKTQIAQGQDPRQERDQLHAVPTISQFFYDTYLPLAKKRKSSWNKDKQRFNDHCGTIAHLKYSELTANHIIQIQLRMNAPSKTKPAS
ncbi:DUF4102 domain-containing protein [Shewanella sp. SNU WT4]|uniref:Arm DNA-binding domain-containing protein n=1 Tax=Shewanella sp. SNU WT4 TaxID=2590015 RepID=UPI00112D144B|nr:Arm DNA-binding domain-containing protein [Shewanella sp. SNU WT4]QDF68243.1 DUF4102 domain-containing protein [Shewanella sp. SNU WT4]